MASSVSGEDVTLVGGDVVAPERQQRLARGESLGRHVLLEELGRGGMGVVFAAYDPELDRKVAIKVLHASLGGETLDSAGEPGSKLLREAQAIARLSHPNVVAIHDVGTWEGRVFLTMEYVEGTTLREWLEGTRTRAEILDAFGQAGAGLAAAHQKGLVHRDFKPENVLVGIDGRIRVLDFGLALASTATTRELDPNPGPASSQSSRLDAVPSGIAGTPAYMSPEQHRDQELSPASDQFSFCVALYEALYQQRPFAASSPAALVLAVLDGKIADPPGGSSVPTWLRRVLLRGLAVAPQDRWASMNELLGALTSDPVARRRRVGGVVVAMGAVGAVAFGLARAGPSTGVCSGARDQLEGVWDGETRAAVDGAFAASPAGYAARAGQRAVERLDAWSEGWVEHYEETCLAHQRGEQSAALFDRSMGCLERSRVSAAALTELLANADADVIQNADRLVDKLPALDRCADTEALLQEVAPPEDATLAQEVEKIRDGLAEVGAAVVAARYEAAREQVEPLTVRALELDYPPVHAEALLARARTERQVADYEEARSDFVRAYDIGLASGHDVAAAAAALDMIRLEGEFLGHPELGLAWAGHGGALTDRLDTGSTESSARRARLLASMGRVLYLKGDYEEALAKAKQALELRQASFGELHSAVATDMTSIGNALQRLGRLNEAEEYMQRGLDLRTQVQGPDHPSTAESWNNLANVSATQGKLDLALERHAHALEIRRAALPADDPVIAASLSNYSEVLIGMERCDEAIPHLEEALGIYETRVGRDKPVLIFALNNLALCHEETRQFDLAIAEYERGLSIVRKAYGEDHPHIPVLLSNMGNIALARDDPTTALARYEQALAADLATLGPDHPDVAFSLVNKGRALMALDRHAEAIAPLERAVELRTKNEAAPTLRAAAQFVLATALDELGKEPARALELAKVALATYQEEGRAHQKTPREIEKWLAARESRKRGR